MNMYIYISWVLGSTYQTGKMEQNSKFVALKNDRSFILFIFHFQTMLYVITTETWICNQHGKHYELLHFGGNTNFIISKWNEMFETIKSISNYRKTRWNQRISYICAVIICQIYRSL